MTTDTFYDNEDMTAAMRDPRYATSERYRAEVAAKLAASREAGTVALNGSWVSHGEGASIHTRTASMVLPQGSSGMNVNGAEPTFAEAAKVSSGFFDGPDAIARAMAAPQFQIDPSYQQAVREKIDRSIRERWIGADFQPLPVAARFTRG